MKTNPVSKLLIFLISSAFASVASADAGTRYLVDPLVKDAGMIFRYLDSSPEENTFHLFTHGRPGTLLLDGKWREGSELAIYLRSRVPLESLHLNIYGCEFAKGEKGWKAVAYLQNALGVAISASDDVTGIGGDWDLEVGKRRSLSEYFGRYPHSLQTTIFKADFENSAGDNAWSFSGSTNQSDGAWVIADPNSTAYQPDGAYEGNQAMITAQNNVNEIGTYDIDATVVVVSPSITLPEAPDAFYLLDLAYYFHFNYYPEDDNVSDLFKIEIVRSTGEVDEIFLFSERGRDRTVASAGWKKLHYNMKDYEGTTFQLRMTAFDGGIPSIAEAGFDAVTIVRNNVTPNGCHTTLEVNDADYDGDGVPDDADADDDNDGISDEAEGYTLSEKISLSYWAFPAEDDGEGIYQKATNSFIIHRSEVDKSCFGVDNIVEIPSITATNQGLYGANSAVPGSGGNSFPDNTVNFQNLESSTTGNTGGYYLLEFLVQIPDNATTIGFQAASTGYSKLKTLFVAHDGAASPSPSVSRSDVRGIGSAKEGENTPSIVLSNAAGKLVRIVLSLDDGRSNSDVKLQWSINGAAYSDVPFSAVSDQLQYTDTDGDGIANYQDLDSDGDGCPDAFEGSEGFTGSALQHSDLPGGNSGADYIGVVNYGVGQNLGNTVDLNGVPTVANGGQGVGQSQVAADTPCPRVCGLNIGGSVVVDNDGSENGVNGSGVDGPSQGLYITLVSGNSVSEAIGIQQDGTYQFSKITAPAEYELVLTTQSEGSTAPSLPSGINPVAEGGDYNEVTDRVAGDGDPDGKTLVILTCPGITANANVDFGLSGAPLPVTLVSFTGQSTVEGGKLIWRTIDEKDFDRFVIQRSVSPQNGFTAIGSVSGGGNYYTYLDNNAYTEQNYYYRLKMIDTDGSYKYSRIVVVTIKSYMKQHKVYPNPSHGYTIYINSGSQITEYQVYDMSGKPVKNVRLSKNGDAKYKFRFQNNVKSGSYLVVYKTDMNIYSRKFTMQD